jgi:hypothetical protein
MDQKGSFCVDNFDEDNRQHGEEDAAGVPAVQLLHDGPLLSSVKVTSGVRFDVTDRSK